MEDKTITIVFGSLGASIALVGVLFAYLQLRGPRQTTTPADMEQAMPPAVVVQEPTINPPCALPIANPCV